MSIQVSPAAQTIIQELIAGGGYDNPAEVVDEALQALVERDKIARLRAMISVGVDQYVQGQVVEWSAGSLERLKQEAEEQLRNKEPIKDEVKP